jgi:hypothetical protein
MRDSFNENVEYKLKQKLREFQQEFEALVNFNLGVKIDCNDSSYVPGYDELMP